MKRNTIKWRIFKYNILAIAVLIILTTAIFNTAVRIYIEKDVTSQLSLIAKRAEETALRKGPDFFPSSPNRLEPPPPLSILGNADNNDIVRFYLMLDRSLREPLSLLNADYILASSDETLISLPQDDFQKPAGNLTPNVIEKVGKLSAISSEKYLNFDINGISYIAIVKPVSEKNTFGLGWIIIYSSIEKVNQLQLGINGILFVILLISAVIISIFSSVAAKKISAPFSSLNLHLNDIAERNFGNKIHLPVDDELKEFVNNINTMSEKLELYDKAQKTFLQNVSHEFRTPLMSIQSYAEGIKYDVVEKEVGANIIIDESKRMTTLVEDLLYLSRLDAIEERYDFKEIDVNNLINGCIDRLDVIAQKNNIKIEFHPLKDKITIRCDEEKLSKAINNVLGNGIRYAEKTVTIVPSFKDASFLLSISDDGPGIDPKDLENIFDRFYKGKKGNFGLGLAIAKNIIEKHGGSIAAQNTQQGAEFIISLN